MPSKLQCLMLSELSKKNEKMWNHLYSKYFLNWYQLKKTFVSPLNISWEISDLCSFCFFFQFGNEEAKLTTEEAIIALILLNVNRNVKKWKNPRNNNLLDKNEKKYSVIKNVPESNSNENSLNLLYCKLFIKPNPTK